LKGILLDLAGAGGAALVSMALALRLLGLSPDDLTRPIVTAGDLVPVYALAKALVQQGWFTPNPAIGAPFAQDLSSFPTMDQVHMVVLNLIAEVTDNPFLVLNTYLMLSFGLAALAAFLAFRVVGVRRIVAFPVAVSFGIHPWPFARVTAHAFLVHTWSIVLGSMLAYAISSGAIERAWAPAGDRARRRAALMLGLLLACAVVAGSGIYYAFFTSILCVLAAVLRLATRPAPRAWTPLVTAAVGIPLFVALGVFSQGLQRGSQLVTGETVARLPIESVSYAGSPAALLLPSPVSGFDRLAAVRQAFDSTIGTAREAEWNSLVGGFAVVALIAWLGLVLASRAIPSAEGKGILGGWVADGRNAPWAWFAVVAILLYVPYGFGSLFAFFVTPDIRAWSRIFPLILFCALMVFALLVERVIGAARGWRRWVVVGLAGVLAVVAMVDQALASVPRLASTESFTDELSSLAGEVEARAPDCSVLQLPAFAFPEVGPTEGWSDYDHLWPYLFTSAGSTTAWSYGAMKGTASGDWQLPLRAAEPSKLAEAARVGGFCGILVDVQAYDEEAAEALVGVLEAEFGPSVESESGRWLFFPVPASSVPDEQREDLLTPVFVIPDPQSFDRPGLTEETLWLIEPSGTIDLLNSGDEPRAQTLKLRVGVPPCGERSTISVDAPSGETSAGEATDSTPVDLQAVVEIPPQATSSIRVTVEGDGCEIPPDTREFYASVEIIESAPQVEVPW